MHPLVSFSDYTLTISPTLIHFRLIYLINNPNRNSRNEEAIHLIYLGTINLLLMQVLPWDVRWKTVSTACYQLHKNILPNTLHDSIAN